MEWDVSLLKAYRCALSENRHAKAVLFPPMDYGIQTGSGANRRIYRFDKCDSEFVDVTIEISSASELFANRYAAVRNRNMESTNKANLLLAEIRQRKKSDNPILFQTNTVQTDVDERLTCEWEGPDRFLPIRKDGTTFYGGNQYWLELPFFGYNACGTVAACNTLGYMATSSQDYTALYPFSTINYDNFLQYIKLMNSWFVKPGPIGIITTDDYIKGVKSFAGYYGTSLRSFCVSADEPKYRASAIVQIGLKADKPVAALNLSTEKVEGESKERFVWGWHWVTITKFFQTSESNQWIAVSSCGKRESINWDVYWTYANSAALKGGFVYFS